jgi:hypothetical protein
MTATVRIEEAGDLGIETVDLEGEEEQGKMSSILGIHSERSLSGWGQEEIEVVDLAGGQVDLVIEEVTEVEEAVSAVAREGVILSRDDFSWTWRVRTELLELKSRPYHASAEHSLTIHSGLLPDFLPWYRGAWPAPLNLTRTSPHRHLTHLELLIFGFCIKLCCHRRLLLRLV